MSAVKQKNSGAYYTPDPVVRSLVRWVVRSPSDRLLDPACGDGRFLALHRNSVGVEQDLAAAREAAQRVPRGIVHRRDFFSWASQAGERFDCAAGNPPFIRYQRFAGSVRRKALALCAEHGVHFSALSSSWAPFLVATSALLKQGGRMAFVIPAEIGHAAYARPVLEYFAQHFDHLRVVAVLHKLFPDLSEDCWLLHAEGYGGSTDHLHFALMDRMGFMPSPPRLAVQVALHELRDWNWRLRAFLLPEPIRSLYRRMGSTSTCKRLRELARVGIGYVTGANEFFHLKPSEAKQRGISNTFLLPSVRSGKELVGRAITRATVETWRRHDERMLLLRLPKNGPLPHSIRKYLDSPAGREARQRYKCRTRVPWYVVPDVALPDGFLSYMSGERPVLVANRADCSATNSVHILQMKNGLRMSLLQRLWNMPLTALSCEIEGHPLGGGMLKLEPREAGNILLQIDAGGSAQEARLLREGTKVMRCWRHYA